MPRFLMSSMLLDKPCGAVRSEIFPGPPRPGAMRDAVRLTRSRRGLAAVAEIRRGRVADRPAAQSLRHFAVEFVGVTHIDSMPWIRASRWGGRRSGPHPAVKTADKPEVRPADNR